MPQETTDLEINISPDDPLLALADAAPGHLLLLDVNERIVFANKEMLEWWELTREQTIGKNIKEVVGEDAYKVLHGFSLDVLSGQNVEYTAPFAKGSQFRYFYNTYKPFKDQTGAIKGFIASGIDVTEKVNLELKVKEYSELLDKLDQ